MGNRLITNETETIFIVVHGRLAKEYRFDNRTDAEAKLSELNASDKALEDAYRNGKLWDCFAPLEFH